MPHVLHKIERTPDKSFSQPPIEESKERKKKKERNIEASRNISTHPSNRKKKTN